MERIIWYDFNGCLHVEFFFEEPFFPAKKLLDESWEEVTQPYPDKFVSPSVHPHMPADKVFSGKRCKPNRFG